MNPKSFTIEGQAIELNARGLVNLYKSIRVNKVGEKRKAEDSENPDLPPALINAMDSLTQKISSSLSDRVPSELISVVGSSTKLNHGSLSH
jgi:hypothetical protein